MPIDALDVRLEGAHERNGSPHTRLVDGLEVGLSACPAHPLEGEREPSAVAAELQPRRAERDREGRCVHLGGDGVEEGVVLVLRGVGEREDPRRELPVLVLHRELSQAPNAVVPRPLGIGGDREVVRAGNGQARREDGQDAGEEAVLAPAFVDQLGEQV